MAGHQDIARRYSSALFDLAKEQGQVDNISADLQLLAKVVAEVSDFNKFIMNTALRREEQARALAAIGDKLKLSLLTKKFLGTLALKRRLSALPQILKALAAEIARHKGELTAEVTAAQALDGNQVSAIAAALKKSTGLNVKVDVKVDAEIMGGLVIQVGSLRIDSSVRSKLERLHRALKDTNTSKNATKMREVA